MGGGGSGTILKTTNGGTNWATQFIGKASFSSVDFADNYTGWAVGNDGSGGTVGTIIRTTNGGTNWIIQTIMPNTALRMIDFININTGWAVGA